MDRPTNLPEAGEAEQLTNLNYGIQLSGGTRLRAPIVGITAENVNVTQADSTQLEQTVADELDLDTVDVRVRPITSERSTGAVEVVTKNVTHQELRTALENNGYQPTTVRDGVTPETRQQMVEAVDEKLRTSALSGASVQIVNVPGGQHFVSITAPDRDREELVDLLNERGTVKIYAVYPGGENGTFVREEVLKRSQMSDISAADREGVGWAVYITVSRMPPTSSHNEWSMPGSATGLRVETTTIRIFSKRLPVGRQTQHSQTTNLAVWSIR